MIVYLSVPELLFMKESMSLIDSAFSTLTPLRNNCLKLAVVSKWGIYLVRFLGRFSRAASRQLHHLQILRHLRPSRIVL